MKKPIITNKLFTILGALLLAVSLTPLCQAQNQVAAPASRTYRVTVTQVKTGMMEQYQQFLKTQTLAAYKKAGGKEWQTWVVESFGTLGEIWTFRPVEDLQQFDEPNFLTKALGEAGARAWNAKRAQMVVSTRSFLISTAPALSLPPKSEPKICIGVRVSVTPGRIAEYAKWLKENGLLASSKTNAKGVFVNAVGLGGDPNEVMVAVLFDNFADLAKFPDAYGKAMTDLKLQINPPVGVVTHTEFAVYRYLPELSLTPPLPGLLRQ